MQWPLRWAITASAAPQELIWATHKEQLTAEGCKRPIANAVNTFNLLLLSGKLLVAESEQDRQVLLKKILALSNHSWHILTQLGTY